MVIIAWHGDGSLTGIVDEGLFRSILSIFITAAILHFVRGIKITPKFSQSQTNFVFFFFCYNLDMFQHFVFLLLKIMLL